MGVKVLNNVLFKKDECFLWLFGFWVFIFGRLFFVFVGIVIMMDFWVVFVFLEVDGFCLIGMSEWCCGCDFVVRDWCLVLGLLFFVVVELDLFLVCLNVCLRKNGKRWMGF